MNCKHKAKNRPIKLLLLFISLQLVILCVETNAQSPQFSMITITGESEAGYNRVSLFENGSATEPLTTQYISKEDRQYSIDVNIPGDMRKKNNYYFTDMRFWNDKNENNLKDEGEVASACHFIIWVPSTQKIYMSIYKGARHTIDSSLFYYNP